MIPEELQSICVRYSNRKEYEILENFFKKLSGFKPDGYLNITESYLGLYEGCRITVFDGLGAEYCHKTKVQFSEFVKKYSNYEFKIPIMFSNFHSAEMDKNGIKFPWREHIFSLDIARALIDAKNKIVAAEKQEEPEKPKEQKFGMSGLYMGQAYVRTANGAYNQYNITERQIQNLAAQFQNAVVTAVQPTQGQPTVTVDGEFHHA